MNCLFLAAGYATRLFPLTENFPKPLLRIKGKSILDWLIEDLDQSGLFDQYCVVSNHKFINIFKEWADSSKYPIRVLDDGTTCNEKRLGAVRDIELWRSHFDVREDSLVMAGDNLLDFSLKSFLSYFRAKNTTCVMRYWESDRIKLSKTGVAEIDESDRIIRMEEKPSSPKSNWCIPPFYCYKASDLSLMKQAIETSCNTDAPGSFIAWLSMRSPVHAYEMPGKRYDIGTIENYHEIQSIYKGYLP